MFTLKLNGVEIRGSANRSDAELDFEVLPNETVRKVIKRRANRNCILLGF